MSPEIPALAAAAFGLGALHTALGPDHYLPFLALGRARGWSGSRTVGVALGCGAAHVASSVALGVGGFVGGRALADLTNVDRFRGSLAGWLLVGLGLTYAVWGTRRALRGRRHTHLHAHADGTLHRHEHDHLGTHAHPHESSTSSAAAWGLFVVFVLGPCEPLLPLFLVPAATGGTLAGLVWVVAAFALATLGTTALLVALGWRLVGSASSRAPAALHRWSHAAAGATLALCGLLIGAGL